MGTSTTTTQNTAGPQSAEAARMLTLLSSTAQDASSQMGDISDLATGGVELDPETLAQIQRIQQILGDRTRLEMERNLRTAQRTGEDTAIGRYMTGGSFEAIQNALLGAQAMHDANVGALERESEGVNLGLQLPRQDAAIRLNANQALLQRLVGGAQGVTNYDAEMRRLNSTSVAETKQPIGSMLFQAGSQLGSSYLGKPA